MPRARNTGRRLIKKKSFRMANKYTPENRFKPSLRNFFMFLIVILIGILSLNMVSATFNFLDWKNCKSINLSTSDVRNNNIIDYNFTGLTFSNITELRITNTDCNVLGIEIKSTVLESGTDWAKITFLANLSGETIYSIYYNNPSDPVRSDNLELVDDFCEFNDDCGWTIQGGLNTSILNGILNISANVGNVSMYSEKFINRSNLLIRTLQSVQTLGGWRIGMTNNSAHFVGNPYFAYYTKLRIADSTFEGSMWVNDTVHTINKTDIWGNWRYVYLDLNESWGANGTIYNETVDTVYSNNTASTGALLGDHRYQLFISSQEKTTDANQNISIDYIRAYDTEAIYTHILNRPNITLGAELSIQDFIENSQTFNNITTEGATETFILNFTKSSLLQISTINLIHNGTSYSSPYTVTEDEVIAERTITIPDLSALSNLSFHWHIIFSDSSFFNSSINNQTGNILNVDDCSVYNNLIYNFTQYDEETKNLLNNNTVEIQFNLYDISKTVLLINLSQKFESINPVQICLESSLLKTVNYSSYVVVKYFANETSTNQSYSVEYHNILNETITNTTVPKNINLYSLKESDTTKFRLTFRDSSYNLAPNILIQVYRQYLEDGDFKIVEIPLTDSNGQTILNLVRNDIIYNLIMVDGAGKIIASFNSIKVFCQDFTIGECTINLNADADIEALYNRDEFFGISITEPSYANSTGLVSISFITDDLLPKTVKIDIVRNNAFGNRSVCSNSLTSASGTLTCDVSSIRDTDQFLFINVFVDGEFFSQYTINLNDSDLSFNTIEGAFFAFLLILFLICMFMNDRETLLIALGLGWVVVISLGLIKGKFIGTTTAGIWLLVSIALMLWKLSKEEK